MTKILLVDDDRRIREIYREALEAEGYRVIEAAEWQGATDQLVGHPDTELVLLDINIPDLSGDELYNAIRLYNPKIRIIMFSVFASDEQRRLVSRADDYFDKADGVDSLLAKVRKTAGVRA